MTTRSLVILEDDPPRIAAMRAAVARLSPAPSCLIFTAAPQLLPWLREHLAEVALLSLDHDLEPAPADPSADPGTGRDVADYLASQPPACPVVIHTSNRFGGHGMFFALRDAGWHVTRVVPSGDLRWVEEQWIPAVADVLSRDGG